MIDLQIFLKLPAAERDALGFERWRQLQTVTTHGTGCHSWGPKHYACALAEIGRLVAKAERPESAESAARPVTDDEIDAALAECSLLSNLVLVAEMRRALEGFAKSRAIAAKGQA